MVYDIFARRIAENYTLFLAALSGRYLAIVAPGVEITPNVVKSFLFDAQAFGETFLKIVSNDVDGFVSELYSESDSYPQTVFDARHALELGIKLAIGENIAQVNKMLRTGEGDYRKVLKNAHGTLGTLIQEKMGRIEFKVYDSANRKWDATKLVKIVARDFAYQTHLDKTLADFAASGATLAQVRYDDATKADRQVVFSISGKIDGYPSFSEIRASAFHMNTTAKVIPYVSP